MFVDYSLLLRLNPTEHLKKSLPLIIEAFVNYYGEEDRSFIEKKFNDSLIFCTQKPDNIERIINDIKEKKATEIIEKLLTKYDFDVNDDNVRKIFSSPLRFGAIEYVPISYYGKYLEESSKTYEERKVKRNEQAVKVLKNIFPNLTKENFESFFSNPKLIEEIKNLPKQYEYRKNQIFYYISEESINGDLEDYKKKSVEFLKNFFPDLTIVNFSEYQNLQKFDVFKKMYEDLMEKMNEFYQLEKDLELYSNYVNSCKELYKMLSKKYYSDFISENSFLFTPEALEEHKKDSIYSFVSFALGNSINSEMGLSAFSFSSDQILKSEPNSYKSQLIKKDRIKFFNGMGIKIDGDYEDYMSNDECIKIIPSYEQVDRIIENKNKYQTLLANDYYSQIGDFVKNRQLIDSLELWSKDDNYNIQNYIGGYTYVSPNVKKSNSEVLLRPIVNINMDQFCEYTDARIIHEFNHILELSCVASSEKQVDYTCGWDELVQYPEIKEDIESISSDDKKRKYELFNEIINELIAQDISLVMHKNNIHIFNTKEEAKIKGGTSYERTIILVKDFFEYYKKDIIKSRKNGNINHIINVVGRENFERLNDLFYEFNEKFGGLKIYKVLDDIINKKETDNTLAYYSMIDRAKKIFEEMKIYSSENLKKV